MITHDIKTNKLAGTVRLLPKPLVASVESHPMPLEFPFLFEAQETSAKPRQIIFRLLDIAESPTERYLSVAELSKAIGPDSSQVVATWAENPDYPLCQLQLELAHAHLPFGLCMKHPGKGQNMGGVKVITMKPVRGFSFGM